MQLGRHLRELWRLRLGVVISFVLALFVAVSSIDKSACCRRSAHGPATGDRGRLDARPRRHAAVGDHRPAHQHLRLYLADHARRSARQRHGQRPGARVHRPPRRGRSGRIEAVSPITADVPRVLERAGQREARERHPALDRPVPPRHPGQSDGARSSTSRPRRPTRTRPSAWPTAPSTGCATTCRAGRRQGTDPTKQVRLEQLGRARGGVINHGIGLQIALLSFIFVFTVSCCAVLFLSRVRRGWRAAAADEAGAPVAAPTPA